MRCIRTARTGRDTRRPRARTPASRCRSCRSTCERAATGLEAAAREARYAALRAAQRDGELVLTAHHADDQAETLLWRMLRGAGPQGLAAMRPLRRFGRGWLARPWLALPRAAIRAYLDGHAIAWIDDPANADPRHDRSFLRHAVLPLLQSRWPQAAGGLARSAAMLDHGARQLRADARRLLARWRGPDPATLRWAALAAATPVLRGAVLREWLLRPRPRAAGRDRAGRDRARTAGRAPGREALRALARRRTAPPSRACCTPWRRWRATPPAYALDWDGRAPLQLPGALGQLVLDDAPPGLALQVRPRRGGERIRLLPDGPNRELKHVLQELGLPPWLRARLPLVWRGEIAAGGRRRRLRPRAARERRALALAAARAGGRRLTRRAPRATVRAMPQPSTAIATGSPMADFEHSLDELETLVQKLERGDLTLDDSLQAFERGVALYRNCQSALKQAELRVSQLLDPEDPDSAVAFEPDTP